MFAQEAFFSRGCQVKSILDAKEKINLVFLIFCQYFSGPFLSLSRYTCYLEGLKRD